MEHMTQNKQKLHQILLTKGPFLATVFAVYAALMVKDFTAFNSGGLFGFSVVILLFSLNYLFYERLFGNRNWIYFIVQGLLLFNITVILGHDFDIVLLGLIPVLYLQSLLLYGKSRSTAYTILYLSAIFLISMFRVGLYGRLLGTLVNIIVISFGLTLYAMLYLEETKLRIISQNALEDLEDAYDQIESLTAINERRRLARDLHDTLSQGLVGVIMQLDAIHANLEKDNQKRATDIASQAMRESREILSETRLMINDLRVNSEDRNDLRFRLDSEVETFERKEILDIQYEYNELEPYNVDTRFQNNIVFIVRELLNNVVKHAQASVANVTVDIGVSNLSIKISDNGKGFNVYNLTNLRGHYGILGIKERVKILGGNVIIESSRKMGTRVIINIPI